MFRRRKRESPPPPAGETALPPSPLVERLRQIGEAAVAPEDALEPALQAVVEASGAGAGALCLFDPRYGILRLAAESGLSDEGCRRLRNVRRGDPASWDMPLHGVLNRRAYLIESAAKNRYVPRLVEHFAAMRTVICVPVYSGPVPLGTVVLVALAPRAFSEGDIRGLERPLRELGRLIEAVRRRVDPTPQVSLLPAGVPHDLSAIVDERDQLRAEMAARFAEHESLIAELASRTQENEQLRLTIEKLTEERLRLLTDVEQTRTGAERADELRESLAAAERERARLAAALEAAALERAEAVRRETALDAVRAEAQRAAREAASELEAARKAAAAAAGAAASARTEQDAEAARLRARVAELEDAAERERQAGRERQREHERLAAELHAAVAREQQVRAELQATVARRESGRADDVREALAQARAAEEGRVAAAAEADALRATVAEQRMALEALEADAGRLRADLGRLEGADTARRADVERLERALAAERGRADAAEARLADTERQATALRETGDRTVADSRERAAELAAVSAHLEAVAAERDRLREARAAVEAERDALVTELAASAAKLGRLEETLVREVAERERMAEALRVAQAAMAALEQSGQAEREAARAEREAPRPAADAGARPRDTMRVLTVAPSVTRTRARDAEGRRIAVLDTDASWEAVTVDGHHAVIVNPEEDTAGILAELAPARIVVNLAAPGALEAVAALRGAGSTGRVWGCIAIRGAERAVPLGMVEVAARPLDCDAILDILKGYTSRGTRVVTAGADVDALMSLRQAMARLGMSVSMAWDAKQATDLLTVVRPEVVVIDLDLPRQAGYGIVARLSVADPVPSAIIVPGKEDAADAFTAALSQPGIAELAVPRERMLGDAVTRQDSAAAERRLHKIRAVGRK
jgi:hypothetical protein